MNNKQESQYIARIFSINISIAAVIFTLIVGSIVIAGWILDIALLKSIGPNLVSMKMNTAIGFFITGVVFWLLNMQEKITVIVYLRTVEHISKAFKNICSILSRKSVYIIDSEIDHMDGLSDEQPNE